MREALIERLESAALQRLIMVLVIVNAVTLGLETVPEVMTRIGPQLQALDRLLLAVFVVELGLKMFAYRLRFFASGWNIFDTLVVGLALLPASGSLAVLRALRVLRILRLISVLPQMRLLVESLMRCLPGIGSILLLLGIFFYVFAVMGTKLFGADHPHWFGSLGQSAFSLFEIMTLEGWSDIAREVMAGAPAAWLFFVTFILVATFTALNLFIALIVKAMEEPVADRGPQMVTLEREIRALRAELSALSRKGRRHREQRTRATRTAPTGRLTGVRGAEAPRQIFPTKPNEVG